MNPFRNIFRLSVGDFFAKTFSFLAFVYLARVLGVNTYGVLEFSISILAYLLLLGDCGLELWSTREAALGRDMVNLVARIVPLRLIFATITFTGLLFVLPILPDYPHLRPLLVLFGMTIFAQALNLKWAFMGKEKMGRVAAGLIVGQIVFAVIVFTWIRRPEQVVTVAAIRVIADFAMSGYFWSQFAKTYNRWLVPFTLRGTRTIFRPALTLGTAHGLSMMSYNFDSVLLGFMLGPASVGLYNAAYKPVTVQLAMPVTYFIGLFPTLSRTYKHSHHAFRDIVTASVRLMAMVAMPIGIVGTFLAVPIIDLLFGDDYARSIPVFQVLIWSAVMTILRGTFRQSLNAAGRQDLDLRCAAICTSINVLLTVLLIPSFGIMGAAFATLTSECAWFAIASFWFNRYVASIRLLSLLWPALTAGVIMALTFTLTQQLFWVYQAALALAAYTAMLLVLKQGPYVQRALSKTW